MLRKILVYIIKVFLFFLLITLILPFVRFVVFYDSTAKKRANIPLIIGHRGSAGIAPENTLAGFEESLNYADIIELDVHLSRDNIVVVMHDTNVDRTTNGKGEITNLDYNYLKELDAGYWFNNNYKGEKIPTLSEVLALVNGKRKVLVELKWPRTGVYEGLVPKVIDIIKSNNAEKWVQIQSFEGSYLTEAINIAPEIRCNQLIFAYSSFPPIYLDRSLHFGNFKIIKGVKSVGIFFPYLSHSFINKMKSSNLDVITFTINNPRFFNRAANLGVDAILTDYPNKLNRVY